MCLGVSTARALNLNFDTVPADDCGRIVENVSLKVCSVPLLFAAGGRRFAIFSEPINLKGN